MSTNALVLAISIVVPLACSMIPLFIAIRNWKERERVEHEDTRTRLTRLEEQQKNVERTLNRIEGISHRIENKVN